MEAIFDESMIRAELRRLDAKTGLHAADLRGNSAVVLLAPFQQDASARSVPIHF